MKLRWEVRQLTEIKGEDNKDFARQYWNERANKTEIGE